VISEAQTAIRSASRAIDAMAQSGRRGGVAHELKRKQEGWARVDKAGRLRCLPQEPEEEGVEGVRQAVGSGSSATP
jgi:methyl-accepting chemotaxis protein